MAWRREGFRPRASGGTIGRGQSKLEGMFTLCLVPLTGFLAHDTDSLTFLITMIEPLGGRMTTKPSLWGLEGLAGAGCVDAKTGSS